MPDPYKPHRNMHISLVMNNSIGVRTLRSDLIRFLLSRGHQVTVLCTIDEAAPDLRRMGASVVNWSIDPQRLKSSSRDIIRCSIAPYHSSSAA